MERQDNLDSYTAPTFSMERTIKKTANQNQVGKINKNAIYGKETVLN